MIAQHHAVESGGGHEPAVRPGRPPAPPPLPAHEKDEQDGDEREVEGVGVGEAAHPPRDRGERQEEARTEPHDRATGQLPDDDDHEARRRRQENRRQEVHPQGGLAGRDQDERREPAQEHVAGIAGGMGRPEDRRHGLELAGVPEALAGEKHAAGQDERHDADEHWRRHRRPGTPERLGRAHQPSVRAQAIPHAWMATERTTRLTTTAIRPRRDAPREPSKRSAPRATATRRNGAKSRLKR